jgi:hypothetical protein
MTTWFDPQDLQINNLETVSVNHLYGYVLPHAGTKYTGGIIAHTLRFRPKHFNFNQVVIFYYPATEGPDVTDVYMYHEYYVPMKSCQYIFQHQWHLDLSQITFIPYNVRDEQQSIKVNLKKTLIIISADFSHFLPFQSAIDLESRAAHALAFGINQGQLVEQIVDDPRTFDFVFGQLPTSKRYHLQWVGRSRSSGLHAVGYLSFLIIKRYRPTKPPDGLFVTCYDNQMTARECLGHWFDDEDPYHPDKQQTLSDKVIHLANTTSRLTGGENIGVPIKYCASTYLYKDTQHKFIRGWHGILSDAFYLPDVLLEHTYENGRWIQTTDDQWINKPLRATFDLQETLEHLQDKAGTTGTTATNVTLYSTIVHHKHI